MANLHLVDLESASAIRASFARLENGPQIPLRLAWMTT